MNKHYTPDRLGVAGAADVAVVEPAPMASHTTDSPVAHTLRDNVSVALANYFAHLDGQSVTGVYEMVLAEVEAPLLEEVMKHTRYNQSKAALLLGFNRATLRKKLKKYGITKPVNHNSRRRHASR